MNIKQLIITVATLAVKIAVVIFIVGHVREYAATAYDFGYRIFTETAVTPEPGRTYEITLKEDTTPKQLSTALKQYGLIRDAKLFYIQYELSEYKGKLQPGTYELTTAQTADEMMAIMSGMTTEDSEDGDTE